MIVDKPFGSVVLLPETSPIKVLRHLHKDIAIGMFIAVFFFVIARKEGQPKCTLVDNWFLKKTITYHGDSAAIHSCVKIYVERYEKMPMVKFGGKYHIPIFPLFNIASFFLMPKYMYIKSKISSEVYASK